MKRWTDDEKRLLRSNMTSEEIAEKTGRSLKAVRSRRYEYTGHTNCDEFVPMREFVSKEVGEARILYLCRKLGIRLEDTRGVQA